MSDSRKWTERSNAWARLRSGSAALFSALALASMAGSVGAETDSAEGKAGPASEQSDILSVPGRATTRDSGAGQGEPGLDELLKLPSDFRTKDQARPVAGASEEEWKRRFARAEKAIGEAHETLAKTRRELDGMAEAGGASQWSVAPPGASGGNSSQSTSPLSFKLRQELVRNREALDEAEKALRELRIEADLAGVPPEWRVVAASPPKPSSEN
jgi:hypothetical protein